MSKIGALSDEQLKPFEQNLIRHLDNLDKKNW